MKNTKALSLSALAGFLSGCVVAVFLFSLKMPSFYSDPQQSISRSVLALPVVIFLYQFIPVASLAIIAGKSRKQLTLKISLSVCIFWLILFFIFWHRRSIFIEGSFPFWAIKRDLVSLLPIMLATAWGFWKVWSRLGPNNRLHTDVSTHSGATQ